MLGVDCQIRAVFPVGFGNPTGAHEGRPFLWEIPVVP